MPYRTNTLAIAVAGALTVAGAAHATSVRLLTMIPVPGEPIESYDIGTVDEKSHLYYQTDRSNKSIDIVSLPVIDKTDNKGGIAVIDPREAKVLRVIEVMDCAPQGLALGRDDHMIIGCNAGSSGSKIPPLTAVFDLKTEKVIASTPKMGGSDMAGYVEKLGIYVVGGREAPGGSSIGLIYAKTNEWT